MAGGILVGSVRVEINPDASNFGTRLRAALSPDADKVSDEIGRSMGRRISDAISDGVRDGLRNAPTSDARRAGESTGRSFADSFKSRVDAALRTLPSIKIDGDSTQVDRKIDDIRNRLLALSSKRIGVDLDSEAALTEMRRLQTELDRLAAESPDVAVKADIARAQEQLRVIQDEVDRVNGDTATVKVKVDDGGSIGSTERDINSLGAALALLAPAAIPVGAALVGGLGSIPALVAAAAGGLGVLTLGVSGVSDAVKLLGQQQQAAAKDAASGAAAAAAQAQAEQSAARQITQAQQSLADARKTAARQAVDDAEQIRQAQQGVVVAERDAARTELQDTQRITDARANYATVQQQVGQQVAAAYDRLEQAETDYATTVQRVEDAEQALADARRQAQRDLENYADSQVDAGLAQRQAVLDLADAQATYDTTMASSTATDAQKAQAQLDLDRAQQTLVESNQRLQQSTEDNNAAQKAGVDGAPGVVAARKQISDANTAQAAASLELAKAQAAIGQAQTDAVNQLGAAQAQIAAAVQQQTRDQQDSAAKVAAAQQQVADAVRSQSRDQEDSAERVAQAQQSVADAMKALALASAGAGVAGTSALAGINTQLAKVNPATLAFAKFWRANILPLFSQLKGAAAGGLLPGLQKGLEALRPLMPLMVGFVKSISTALGDLFASAGKALTSPFWVQFFTYVNSVAGPYIKTFGQIIGNLARGFAGLMEAFKPVTDTLVAGLGSLAKSFGDFGAGASGNSGFQAFLAYVRREGPVVVDAVKNIAVIVGKLIEGLAPLGAVILKVVDAVAQFLSKLSPNELLGIAAAVGVLVAAFGGPFTAIAVAVTAIAALITNNWDAIKGVFSAAWEWISDFVKSHWVLIVSLLTGPIGYAVIEIVKHWDDIKDAFTAAWNWVKGVFAAWWDLNKTLLIKPIQAAADFFTAVFGSSGAIRTAFTAVKDWVVGAFNAAWEAVKTVLTYPVAVARDFFYDVFGDRGAIRTAFSAIATWVGGAFSAVWSAVKDVLAAPVGAARDFFYDVFGPGGAVRTAFSAVASWVSGTFGKVWSGIESVFLAPIRAVETALSGAFGPKGAVQGAFNTLVSAVSKIWSGLEDIFKAPIKFLINTVLNDGLISAWNWVASKIPGIDVTIKPISPPKGFATGGAVRGPGGPTSDSIPAMLSNNEHVWTAREVAGAGGHERVAQLRAAALGNDVAHYATGGAVLTQAADAIKATNPLPYIFGATGPNGYDCSGLVGLAYNIITGAKDIYRRAFTTFDEANYFSPGTGFFTVGVTNSGGTNHTAGELGGMKFEARDTAEGIIIGGAAKDPRTFDSVYHLPLADKLAIAGKLPNDSFGSDIINAVNPVHWYDEFKKLITKPLAAINKFASTDVGKIIAGVPGGLATGMVDAVKKALTSGSTNVDPTSNRSLGELLAAQAPYGWTSGYGDTTKWTPTQTAEWNSLNNLWTKESGWSQYADTRASGLDAKNASTFAYGIAQARPATKYPVAGRPDDLGGHSDAGVQIKWGLDYIKGRYGDPISAWAHEQEFNWYDQGGWLKPGPSLVYNGTGHPEPVFNEAQWNQLAALANQGGGGGQQHFEGNLYLDSGEFLGKVRGEANEAIDGRLDLASRRQNSGVNRSTFDLMRNA